ncbi:hypothetical protein [Sorangium sp. So ce131]|uniref:hypothetical protein n=1 Tax=Sorangium sp. So ce131 TaxID=3133282 RepID=UPI003F605C31
MTTLVGAAPPGDHGPMMTVFEVYLASGAGSSDLLSAEVLRETGAQVMTLKEAELVGFQGLEPLDGSGDVRLIAVRAADAPWIHRCLEGSGAVVSFRAHQVD